MTLGLVSSFARALLHGANTTRIINQEALIRSVEQQPEQHSGVLTVANHTSMFDDPGILSVLMPWHWLWLEPVVDKVRWSLCAKEVCFKNELLRHFFLNGNTLPVERGKGVHQPIVSVAALALAAGKWVHVFPEGRINFDGKLGPLRWGAGKLVCEARRLSGGKDPIVLPFYHSGMGHVLPLSSRFFKAGHEVEVRIGEPVPISDVTCKCDSDDVAVQQEAWKAITERIRAELQRLEALSPPNPDQTATAPMRNPPPS